MSEHLFDVGPTDSPPSLTGRQAHALNVIRERQPIRSDALGAELHAYRLANGGKGHSADTFCDFCVSEGRQVGEALHKKGLARYALGAGWTTSAEASDETTGTVQVGINDPWPEGMF